MGRIFEKGAGEHYGLYIASYEGEGVCKIGVTSDLRTRLDYIRGYSWVPVTVVEFFFPFRTSGSFESLVDNFSILKVSAFALEKACHEKLKELGLHLRGEFFEIFAGDAIAAVRKVAGIEGFKLASPSDIIRADIPIHRSDDRIAYLGLMNAACLAAEVLDAQHDDRLTYPETCDSL